MKAFKGFDVSPSGELSCKGFVYKIGVQYEYEGEIRLCSGGFHSCKKMKNVKHFYSNEQSWHEVEIGGCIIDDEVKTVSSKIKVLRKLSPIEIYCRYGYGNGNGCGCGDGNIYSVIKY